MEDIKFIKTLSLLLWWDKGQVKVWSACSLFWWHQQREREGGSEGEGGFFLSGKPKSASRTTSWFTSLCCASALNFFFSFFFPNSNSSETFTFWKGMFPGRRLQPSWAPLSSPWELRRTSCEWGAFDFLRIQLSDARSDALVEKPCRLQQSHPRLLMYVLCFKGIGVF